MLGFLGGLTILPAQEWLVEAVELVNRSVELDKTELGNHWGFMLLLLDPEYHEGSITQGGLSQH